ncbi:MAG: ArnT family glycosyltransferase, partial [Hyphomicrobiales bacterium]
MTRSSQTAEADWTARALLWLAAILAFRIAALALNRTDLMFDEAQYWSWSRDLEFGYFSKPPLIGWLIAGATGLCGDTEFCVRLPSPLLYALGSIFVFLAARRLYGARTGFWSALVFSTLPGVSFSSGIISTDVPLLVLWALALWAFVELLETRQWRWAILLGVAVGLGLNAKYAMIYFAGCAALYVWREPSARWLARDPRA